VAASAKSAQRLDQPLLFPKKPLPAGFRQIKIPHLPSYLPNQPLHHSGIGAASLKPKGP
jgi:hypothetical protein